jgi:membrane protease YdiL (CAAX protease family)
MVVPATDTDEGGRKRLSIAVFIGLVVVYLAILQGVVLVIKPDGLGYGELPDGNALWRFVTLPVGLSVLFVIGVITYLRWWKPVIHDDKPVNGWVKIVPALLVVSVIGTTSYSNIVDQRTGLVLALLASTALVGLGEELMFRGLGVVAFRDAGFTEGKVALWTSVIFGAVHMTNVFTEGPGAFLQAAVVSITGYFFYLSRRSFGTILVPVIIHGLYDFSIFSHAIGLDENKGDVQSLVPMLIGLILFIVVFSRFKKIEPDTAAA